MSHYTQSSGYDLDEGQVLKVWKTGAFIRFDSDNDSYTINATQEQWRVIKKLLAAGPEASDQEE